MNQISCSRIRYIVKYSQIGTGVRMRVEEPVTLYWRQVQVTGTRTQHNTTTPKYLVEPTYRLKDADDCVVKPHASWWSQRSVTDPYYTVMDQDAV